ncbi:hypothetical protein D046_0503B, partial [Vibrio parahaemolyticus V-223/04]|jgi:hypothetical protein
LSK